MPNMTLNGTEFYDAPKNAGTTVRMWLKHYEGDLPEIPSTQTYYSLKKIGFPNLWVNNVKHDPQFFTKGEDANIRWCIKRDPVDRFISAYTDKIRQEGLVDWSIDTCLSLLETGEMTQLARGTTQHKLAACHFLKQCIWFGETKTYYHHVFDISEMNHAKEFCEDVVFKMKMPALHARAQSQSGVEKIILTSVQRSRVEKIYIDDYAAGWC